MIYLAIQVNLLNKQKSWNLSMLGVRKGIFQKYMMLYSQFFFFIHSNHVFSFWYILIKLRLTWVFVFACSSIILSVSIFIILFVCVCVCLCAVYLCRSLYMNLYVYDFLFSPFIYNETRDTTSIIRQQMNRYLKDARNEFICKFSTEV